MPPRKDLIVLVPDKTIETTIQTLLITRQRSLQIKNIQFDIISHPDHDPGCFLSGHELLKNLSQEYDYALIVFDRDGCGSSDSRLIIEENVLGRLEANSWKNRSDVIVIDPEIEAWVWSNSPNVQTCLGWNELISIKDWINSEDLWPLNAVKPTNPKLCYEKVLKKTLKPRSPSIFKNLAQSVGIERCIDPAFIKFKALLIKWFPIQQK